ncbi:MAG: hypothetical protein ACXVCL_20505 [Bdellovibrio sp.]
MERKTVRLSLTLQTLLELGSNNYKKTKQPPAQAGGFEERTQSPDTRRLNDAS